MRIGWINIAVTILSLPLLIALSACDNSPNAKTEFDHRWEESLSSLDGAVFFRERIALPLTSELEVLLLDLTDPRAPKTLISSGTIIPVGSPPYNFSISVNLANLDREKMEKRSYGLRATIHVDGRLMFANEDFVEVTGGAPKQILVHRVPTPDSIAVAGLEGIQWGLQWLEGHPSMPTGSNNRHLDIRFLAENTRAAGFSGCNRYTSTYTMIKGDDWGGAITLGPAAGTRMACAQGKGDVETTYLEMLARVTAFKIKDDTLSLMADDKVVAMFKPM